MASWAAVLGGLCLRCGPVCERGAWHAPRMSAARSFELAVSTRAGLRLANACDCNAVWIQPVDPTRDGAATSWPTLCGLAGDSGPSAPLTHSTAKTRCPRFAGILDAMAWGQESPSSTTSLATASCRGFLGSAIHSIARHRGVKRPRPSVECLRADHSQLKDIPFADISWSSSGRCRARSRFYAAHAGDCPNLTYLA